MLIARAELKDLNIQIICKEKGFFFYISLSNDLNRNKIRSVYSKYLYYYSEYSSYKILYFSQVNKLVIAIKNYFIIYLEFIDIIDLIFIKFIIFKPFHLQLKLY